MKKILFLFLIIPFVFACSDDDDEEQLPSEVSMKFYAYTKYTPSSVPTKNAAKFFLFDSNNGQKYKEEKINLSGKYLEYSNTHSEMCQLLRNNEFELEDGTRVKPISINGKYYISLSLDLYDLNKWNSLLSENNVKIPEGKYYIVCLVGTSSGWAFHDKYSGKYVTVSKNMIEDDKAISIEFPHDVNRKGYVDWITTNWDYEGTGYN